MKSLIKIIFLLCTCLAAFPLHAQENSDLKGTSCIPVRTVKESELAFKAGERMHFSLHYKWGAINSDVGTATVSLDSVRLNGHEAFLCRAHGRTTKLFDLFFNRKHFRSSLCHLRNLFLFGLFLFLI